MTNTRIKVLIIQWFDMLRAGEVFTIDQLHEYVLRFDKSKPSRKTVQNNVAMLKRDGKINYRDKSYLQVLK